MRAFICACMALRSTLRPANRSASARPSAGVSGCSGKCTHSTLTPCSLLQLLNTHGTEIAPGSDVVGEDLDRHWLAHAASRPRLDTAGHTRDARLNLAIILLSATRSRPWHNRWRHGRPSRAAPSRRRRGARRGRPPAASGHPRRRRRGRGCLSPLAQGAGGRAPLAHSDDDVREWIRARLIPVGRMTVAVVEGQVVGLLTISWRRCRLDRAPLRAPDLGGTGDRHTPPGARPTAAPRPHPALHLPGKPPSAALL